MSLNTERGKGRVFPVEITANYLGFDGKEYTFAFARDLTERKRTEAQLRNLSRAVEQSPASVVITDTNGTIEYVNPKFTQLTGYTQEEAVGKTPRLLKSGMQSTAFYQQLWQTILSGREWRGEFANRKKNGEIYWESASVVPIRNSDGTVTHFLAVKEDITERKQSESALVQAEEKYRSLVFNIPDVAWTLDAAGRYSFISPQIEKVSGYSASDVEEQGSRLFLGSIHPDDAARVRGCLEALFQRDETYDVECRIRRKNGEWIWIHDRAVATYEKRRSPLCGRPSIGYHRTQAGGAACSRLGAVFFRPPSTPCHRI